MAIDYKDPAKNVSPKGRIRFYKGFALDPSYENTLYFPNKEIQNNFFASHASTTITYNNGSTDAPNMAIKSPYTRTFMIPANSSELFEYNYMQVTPEVGEDGSRGKELYMFITQVVYINENVVMVTAELDVIQTFMFDWYIGEQRVERMHSQLTYNRYDEQLKLAEPYNIDINECVKDVSPKIDLNSFGYLLVVTDYPNRIAPLGTIYYEVKDPGEEGCYWYGYTASHRTDVTDTVIPATQRHYGYTTTGRDGNQLIYLYVKPGVDEDATYQRLLRVLNQYDFNSKLSSIKRMYCIPDICSGDPADAILYTSTGGVNIVKADNLLMGSGTSEIISIRQPGINQVKAAYEMPLDVNGYLPIDPKTYNLLRFRFSFRNGASFILGPNEFSSEELYIIYTGYCGLSPAVRATVGAAVGYEPTISKRDWTTGYVNPVSSNPPTATISAFPAGAVFNSDAVDAYNTQFISNQMTKMLSLF